MNEHILVTGGAGYIGSHVCKELSRKGFIPVTYDNFSSGRPDLVKWGPLEEGDIRDRKRLSEVIIKYRPVGVIHLAALIQVAESVSDPSLYYNNNVYGSYCLLDELRQHGIKNVVVSSTAAVYGQPRGYPILEGDIKQPINAYGNTKLTMEHMVQDYSCAYGISYAILRYFNAAGADPDCETGTAYKKDTHIIPILMNVACNLSPSIKIFGTDYETPDGTAIRDYVHVSDIADIHVLVLQYLMANKRGLILNVGTSSGHSVKEVIDTARLITKRDISVEVVGRREGDPAVLIADASKAQEILGWCPKNSTLERIIQTAWSWKQQQISSSTK